ncbi:exodeoxyribonuclease III [Polycladidibacter hongkongensis]|uniref:exodeoxyribonuclease III n=1 Tax=Polycladidibacter hongkongensis TaxID=1647556 RepID=UPI000829A886|nr:exodeoxyribonuclease III [Pseudovibrio hongkongensis]
MKIASWNINGIKARMDTVLRWLQEEQPDLACFQEIKSIDEAFPREPIEALGYHLETHGQKGFNGVALLSKTPFEEVIRRLPGDEADEQARYIEGVVATDNGPVRLGGLYLPNGNPVDTPKFPYKLAWMQRLNAHAAQTLQQEEAFILAGDYNVIPDPQDAAKPETWVGDALYRPESRQAFRALNHLGFTEAIRATQDAVKTYTFWDYQAGAWQRNNGIRIDHLLLSPEAADRLQGTGIDKHVRDWEKPSDHVPVWLELN